MNLFTNVCRLIQLLFLYLSPILAKEDILSSQLAFTVNAGSNDNYFLRDNITAAQMLLTSTNNTDTQPKRFIVALPAGNSGALTYFLPLNTSAALAVNLVNGTFKSAREEFNNTGVQADLSFNNNATLGVTIIGSVRAMRDYIEGNGTMNQIFNYTLAAYNKTSVRLHRRWINVTTADPTQYRTADLYLFVPPDSNAQFNITPGNNGTFMTPTIDILLPSGSTNGTISVKVVTNETSLVGLNSHSLFLPETQDEGSGLPTALQKLSDGKVTSANQVSFLTYTDRFLAGGWRFLTYFGRDTLIALRLLMPVLTSDAIEAVLGAVIERTNSTGALCHEETIADYASFINIQNNRSDLGNQPFYDYKMIDTDLLLLPALNHYLLDLPQGKDRAVSFLSQNATLQNGTYAEILNRTITYNLGRALPFFQNSTVSNLIGLRPGQSVGNWRDSTAGLGYGFYPFDVNTALVPASLRATQALLNADIIYDIGMDASEVGQIAEAWEQRALALFDITIDLDTSQSRLEDFVQAANLSTKLLSQSANVSRTGSDFSYYALSLMQDGAHVEVLNSDIGFDLMYGSNVSQTFLQHVVNALQPYPRGLLTNVGMVVANPAYDSNRTMIQVLNRAAYHGTVIWSFQQGLTAGGLARQLGFCSIDTTTAVDVNPPPSAIPSWCSNSTFVQSLRDAETRLWTSINEIYAEVWSYSFENTTSSFKVADLAELSPDGTESDAIQLWSYGFLALLDPTRSGSTSN